MRRLQGGDESHKLGEHRSCPLQNLSHDPLKIPLFTDGPGTQPLGQGAGYVERQGELHVSRNG